MPPPPRDASASAAAALSWVLMVAGPGQQAPVPFINETVRAAPAPVGVANALQLLALSHCPSLPLTPRLLQVGAAQMYGNKILQK